MKYSGRFKNTILRLKSSILGYFKISNLHGFQNIAAENVKWHERCFWMTICLFVTALTVLMLARVWERFQRSPTMTTIETNNYPLKNVPFPAITICNLNRILKSSFDSAADKFEEKGVNRSALRKFLKEIPQIYSTRLTSFENQDIIVEAMQKLGYTLESFLFDLSQPCSQFLVRCLWLGREYNCSAMFDEVKTPEGFCCSFNFQGLKVTGYDNTSIRKVRLHREKLIHQNKRRNLYVNDASTTLSGLTVVVDVDEGNYFASVDSFFGSLVILHSSVEYPDSYSPKAFVQPRSEALIRLRASVVESTSNVRLLNIPQRQCYFPEEHFTEEGVEYSYEACTLDCKLYTYQENCNCIPFYYPNLINTTLCTLNQMKCIGEYRVEANQDTDIAEEDWSMTQKEHCKCLPSCNDINYEWIVQTNEIRSESYASPVFEGNLGNRSAISVFYEQNVCIKYRMESQVTWDSVIASFGGIFSLSMGGSIISLVELFYYFVREWLQLSNRKKGNPAKLRKIGKSEKDLRKKISTPAVILSFNSNKKILNSEKIYPYMK